MTQESTAVQQRAGALTTLEKEQFDYILLDGSGSMMGDWYTYLDAIDTYVAELKNCKTQSHLHLSIFTDGDPSYIDMVAKDEPIDSWVPLSANPVGSHFQGTPLYDAIEIMCSKLHRINPDRCAITIVTDGGEAGSRSCDLIRAKTLLDWARAKGWSVTFIGCEFDNSGIAKSLGATAASAIGVQNKLLKNAVQEYAKKRHAYGVTGAPVHWSEEEQRQFGGYLAAPEKR